MLDYPKTGVRIRWSYRVKTRGKWIDTDKPGVYLRPLHRRYRHKEPMALVHLDGNWHESRVKLADLKPE